MRRGILLLFALSLLTIGLLPVWAESPVPVIQVAPLDDLVYEVNDRIAELEKLLSSAEDYEDSKDTIRRGFGVLTVVGQAIAEHGHRQDTKIQGPDLRDGAKQFTPKSTHEEAKSALTAVKQAQSGEAEGSAIIEHDWAKLINMHPMMEEIEDRAGKINRVVRRPRGKPEEPVHASVIAILTVAMHEDVHEVKNPDDIPAWKEFAREYLDQMTSVGEAIRQKDKEAASELMVQATETCDKCHEKFRD